MKPAQRIVHVIPDFGLGGIQKAGCVLAKEMAHNGHACLVLGAADGPRFVRSEEAATCLHVIAPDASIVGYVRDFRADVVHIHHAAYRESLIRELIHAAPRALIVSTPVFGRPPKDRGVLPQTKTCCVGVFTLYRLLRWLQLDPAHALPHGFGFVPMTPFCPLDDAPGAATTVKSPSDSRRARGIPENGFYVGRIGRNTPSKWSTSTATLVNSLLEMDDGIRWLSVGFPTEYGRDALLARWGERFIDFPETADSRRLAATIRCLDVQVFFSRYGECFSSCICEAAGEGVPTVALSTPFFDNGQAEQVIDGTTGFLVSSISAAQECIGRLRSSPESLASLRQTTFDYARRNWLVSHAAAHLIDLYDYWRHGGAAPDYVPVMRQALESFATGYKARISRLSGDSGLSRLRTMVGLTIYEHWRLFTLARSIRRGLSWL